MCRFPIRSDLPGLSNVQVSLQRPVPESGRATIIDTQNQCWVLNFGAAGAGLTMTIPSDDSMCTFQPWPAFPEYWSASGLWVNSQRVGLASAFYRCALLLIPHLGGQYISPSDNVTRDGRGLWSKLDPSVRWEPVEATGGFRLDLTGRSPP